MNRLLCHENWVKTFMIGVFLLQSSIFLQPFSICSAQTGSWHTYMSYYEPQQIVKSGHQLFVRASNDLYSYNLNDHSITTYDKNNLLSDTYITIIGLNKETQKLLVVYQNQNMDIFDCQNDEVENISALYLKSMTTDKTINSIYMYDRFAYLATGFGIMKVNMKKDEIADSYILNKNVKAVAVSGDSIYGKIADGSVIAALLTANLIDPNNWVKSTKTPADIFKEDLTDWNQYIETVKSLKPGGPKFNRFYYMRYKHDRLYTAGGGYTQSADLENVGTAQILQNNEWIILPDNLTELTGWNYRDAENIDADPNDPEHIMVGARSGLYEFKDGAFVKAYNIENSPLESFLGNSYKDYVLILAGGFDKEGNYWCCNSQSNNNSLMELTKDGQWVSHKQSEFLDNNHSLNGMRSLMVDSRGYIWFVNDHWGTPSFYCYDPNTRKVLNSFQTLKNQDGITIDGYYYPHCVVEDLEGNIWVGTEKGPIMVEKENIGQENANVTQVKVPRNDGTNYADYLLNGANVRCIAVDGGGRKWFGTEGTGLYLISADNITELAHYTVNDSPILSNTIYSLAINNKTGELFIGTDKGLCSFMTDATDAVNEMNKDDVYAFPNPVVSGYNGLITIRGLSLNSDVKILTASGKLIAQGRSNGGTFTWDGRDSQGRRVATGIYMVAAAKSDGSKGTVCKIAFIQ